jgi:hypothetical protein
LGQAAHLHSRVLVANHDHPPRLHESDRRSMVGSRQHASEHLLGNVIGAKSADVAPLRDDSMDRFQRLVGKTPAARIGGTLDSS